MYNFEYQPYDFVFIQLVTVQNTSAIVRSLSTPLHRAWACETI